MFQCITEHKKIVFEEIPSYLWDNRQGIIKKTHLITQIALVAFTGYLGWELMVEEDPTRFYPFIVAVLICESASKLIKNVQSERRLFALFQKSLPIKAMTVLSIGSFFGYGNYYFNYQPALCDAFSNCKENQDKKDWIRSCYAIMDRCKQIVLEKDSFDLWSSPSCLNKFNFSSLPNSHFYYECSYKSNYGNYNRRYYDLFSAVAEKLCVNFFPEHKFKKAFQASNCITLINSSDYIYQPCDYIVRSRQPTIVLKLERMNEINQIFANLLTEFVLCNPTDQQVLPERIEKRLIVSWLFLGGAVISGILECEVKLHWRIIYHCNLVKERLFGPIRQTQRDIEIES